MCAMENGRVNCGACTRDWFLVVDVCGCYFVERMLLTKKDILYKIHYAMNVRYIPMTQQDHVTSTIDRMRYTSMTHQILSFMLCCFLFFGSELRQSRQQKQQDRTTSKMQAN